MGFFTNEKLNEFNEFLYERRVAFVGINRSTVPIIDYFHRHNAKISIFDKRTLDKLNVNVAERIINYNMNYSLGENCLKKLRNVDLVIKSPEYRPDEKEILEAENRGAIVVSVQDLLIELCPGKVIGIVGEYNVNLIYLLINVLKESGHECFMDDNPKRPLLCRINEMDKNSMLILPIDEKDIFSLKYTPDISIVDNIQSCIDENFLSYDEYIESIKIYSSRQIDNGKLIFNADTDFSDNCILNDSNVLLYSTNKKLDNGIIFENNIIKICNDGIRRHFMDNSYVKLAEAESMGDICAVLACMMNLKSHSEICFK